MLSDLFSSFFVYADAKQEEPEKEEQVNSDQAEEKSEEKGDDEEGEASSEETPEEEEEADEPEDVRWLTHIEIAEHSFLSLNIYDPRFIPLSARNAATPPNALHWKNILTIVRKKSKGDTALKVKIV